jgi:hypothetical protein
MVFFPTDGELEYVDVPEEYLYLGEPVNFRFAPL